MRSLSLRTSLSVGLFSESLEFFINICSLGHCYGTLMKFVIIGGTFG